MYILSIYIYLSSKCNQGQISAILTIFPQEQLKVALGAPADDRVGQG